MPTKNLPVNPDLGHLKDQAKDLLQARESGDKAALQRIREFHPRFTKAPDAYIASAPFKLSDAQLAIAREYGYASWPRLKAHIDRHDRPDSERPLHEKIVDPAFRHAVGLLDAGDAEGLRTYLKAHPGLSVRRVQFEGMNYFRNPSLLEFCAENPIRNRTLPANIGEVIRVILDDGAREDRSILDAALGLVASGCVPRECGVQTLLIDLLCDYGADPNQAAQPAIVHGEFAAAEVLIRRGAHVDLPTASALGKSADAARLLPQANGSERHLALAYAAQFGRADIARLLLESGEDPNRYNPLGAHSHSTPLHQAAFYGHLEAVRVLVEHGADTDLKDIHFNGTPLGWAMHGGRQEVVDFLTERSRTTE